MPSTPYEIHPINRCLHPPIERTFDLSELHFDVTMFHFANPFDCCLLLLSSTHLCLMQHLNLQNDTSSGCTPSRYPFHVAIQKNKVHFCGGSLLRETWVLTAAHCCFGKTNGFYVIAGLSSFTRTDSPGSHAINLYPHPKYNARNYLHDIGLIQLGLPIHRSAYVNLADMEDWYMYRRTTVPKALVIGFRYTRSMKNKTIPEGVKFLKAELKCLHVDIARDIDCDRKTKFADETSFCSLDSLVKGPCKGDSGSPVMHNDVQYGVVSSGSGCQLSEYTKYIRVDVHEGFIKTTMEGTPSSSAKRSVPNSYILHMICFYIATLILIKY